MRIGAFGGEGLLGLGRLESSSHARSRFALFRSCKVHAQRQQKDPKAWGSVDDLRTDLEKQQPGFVTTFINWLSSAATSSASANSFDLKSLYKKLLSIRPILRSGSWDEAEQGSLDELEAEIGSEVVAGLQVVLLGTRQSTLKIIRRYPAILSMDRSHVMERLIWMKGLFPGSDVTRMVELAPASFLAGDWGAVQTQLSTASELLRGGLRGADFNFMFTEDPAILFEEPESLRVGLRRLRDLWEVDETALANSDPLHLTLAVRALGTNGPPKGF